MKFFFKIQDLPIYFLIIFICILPFKKNTNITNSTKLIELVVEKKTIALFDRYKDSTYKFSGFAVEIKQGKCRMIQSSCEDHLCEKFGWLDSNSTARIICLPQKIIIKNVQNQRNKFDDITE